MKGDIDISRYIEARFPKSPYMPTSSFPHESRRHIGNARNSSPKYEYGIPGWRVPSDIKAFKLSKRPGRIDISDDELRHAKRAERRALD